MMTAQALKPFELLPPHPATCQQCATTHPPHFPHNQQSLFWLYWFFNEHGRWPTWSDAMAHCDDQMKAFWRIELAKQGVEVAP